MPDDNFSQHTALLEDVSSFGLESVNDYLCMSGDAGGWQVPECWPQTEIARKLRSKYGLYIWLELPVARVLEWESPNPEKPLTLEGERNGGRFDIGLFSATQKPNEATFLGVIEVKRHIIDGSECDYDAQRIVAMKKLFKTRGIVCGMFIGDGNEVETRLISGLGIPRTSVCRKDNPEKYVDDYGSNYAYGFIAALI